MERGGRDIDRVERSLRKAWRQRIPGRLPEGWKAAVMRDVLEAEPAGVAPMFDAAAVEARIVWRFAAAAAIVAVAFTVYLFRADLPGISELAMMMLQDPAGFVLSQPFV